MSCLRAIALVKTIKGKTLVDHVDLEVSSGQIVGLLGPNGAGKTTCFYLLIGLIQSEGGEVLLDSQSLTTLPMHERARLGLGYLPQESSIFRQMTAEENILAVLELRTELTAADRRVELEKLLEEFQLHAVRHTKAPLLSGGERRRVEIARALASKPKFMLLDEPFAGVDPISVSDIKKLILHLSSRGIGILITDHNVRETLAICEHAYILSRGKVLAKGSASEILADPEVRSVYLGEEFML